MKQYCLLFLGILLAGLAASAQSTSGEFLKQLSSGDSAVRSAAFESAAQQGPASIVAIAPLLDSGDFEIARAARIALEKIVGSATASEDTRQAASRALGVAVISVQNRDWLLWLLSYVGGEESIETLLGLLDSAPQDFDRVLMTLESLARRRGEDGGPALLKESAVARHLLAKLPLLPEPQQIAVSNTLGAIRAEEAVEALTSYAAKDSPLGRSAEEALGRIGTQDAAADLLAAWLNTGEPRTLDALLRAAEAFESKHTPGLYRSLLEEKSPLSPDAGPAARAAMQCAAILALSRTPLDAKELVLLLECLNEPRADVFGSVRQALVAVQGETFTRTLERALRKAEGLRRQVLLQSLAERDPARARPLLLAALEDEEEAIRSTALELLGRAPDANDAEVFLNAAKEGSESLRPVALQGYLKLAAGTKDSDQSLEMYHTALGLASRDAERLAALEGLRILANPATLPHLEGVGALSAALEVPVAELQLAIAGGQEDTDPAAAQALYRKVLAESRARKVAKAAAEALRRSGVQEDFARAAGFLTEWQIIGPFAAEAFAQQFPPEEQPYDPAAIYPGAEGQQLSWRDCHTEDPLGIVDLDDLFKPNEKVIGYARTVINLPQAAQALMKIGSDDGVVVWLNGQQVHKNNAQRRVRVDQDVVPVSLQAGENMLLLKIVQGGSDWGYTVRLTTPEGTPLR